jgi:uncharacterized protein YwgA
MRATISHDRELKDTAQDVFLLLYLIQQGGDNVSGKNRLDAQIKLMKLVFLAEKKMLDSKLKGFNFFYNIYKHGPSSMELLQLVDDLRSQKLIEFDVQNNIYSLTPKAKRLILDFKEENEPTNSEFFEIINLVVQEEAKLSTGDLVKKVYAMKMVPLYSKKEVKIGEEVSEDKRTRLLMKLQDPEKELTVSPEWVTTLNIVMHPEFVDL